MPQLWDFKRRSSSLVRYLHGGTTALYPWQSLDSMPALLFEAYAFAAAADSANMVDDNILSFPARESRLSRAHHHSQSGPRLASNKCRKD
ncbi:MAG: hypothetical protein VX941_03690 [Pseudomonadota bacterium]|nr:hypothetical protein [Pseudomonadota bacterium]